MQEQQRDRKHELLDHETEELAHREDEKRRLSNNSKFLEDRNQDVGI